MRLCNIPRDAICEFVFKAHRGRRLHADWGPSYYRICVHLCYLSLCQCNEEHKEEEPAGSAFCTPEYMHINTHMHDDMSNSNVIKWSMLWCRMDLIAVICPLLWLADGVHLQIVLSINKIYQHDNQSYYHCSDIWIFNLTNVLGNRQMIKIQNCANTCRVL